jgi:hypothetical protein
MPVSLARRIRRLGLLPSTKDDKGHTVHNHNPEMTDTRRQAATIVLRIEAKQRRLKQRGKK